MLTYKYLKEHAFVDLCRDCMNEKYSLKLKKRDYLYYHGNRECAGCGECRHIVSSIRKGKRYKVWFGKKPKTF